MYHVSSYVCLKLYADAKFRSLHNGQHSCQCEHTCDGTRYRVHTSPPASFKQSEVCAQIGNMYITAEQTRNHWHDHRDMSKLAATSEAQHHYSMQKLVKILLSCT